jgi:hypothetical protein
MISEIFSNIYMFSAFEIICLKEIKISLKKKKKSRGNVGVILFVQGPPAIILSLVPSVKGNYYVN